MNRPLTALIVCVWLGCSGPSTQPASPSSSDWCVSKGAIAWLLKPTRAGHVDTKDVSRRAAAVRSLVAACTGESSNLGRFVGAVSRQHNAGFKFGFAISDRAYARRRRLQTQLPELLRSQEFLRTMRRPSGYRRAIEMIDNANAGRPVAARWTTLFYKSQFLLTPDKKTYGRLLIHIPGPPVQWIQFGVVTPEMDQATPMHSVSIVAVDNGQADWMDYWRMYDGDHIRLPSRVLAGHKTINCYHCHKTPVVPIHPATEYRLSDTGSLQPQSAGTGGIVARLNAEIRGYGPAAFNGLLDAGAYGPALGDPARHRGPRFMARCTEPYRLARDAVERVRRSMTCGSCHDGDDVSAINYPQAMLTDQDVNVLKHPDSGVSAALVPTYIRQGLMPPKSKLRGAAEREALINCLMMDYFDPTTTSGALVDWLRGR